MSTVGRSGDAIEDRALAGNGGETSDVTARIDGAPWVISAELDDRPDLADGWDAESEAGRASWYAEWFDLLARFRPAEDANHAGLFTSDQERRYRDHRARVRAATPIIKRLGLPVSSHV
jgi:hypothetical protein